MTKTTEHETYAAFVRRQFRKNTLGVVSLYIVLTFAVIAIFADFLCGEKPIICKINSDINFPIIKSYGVSLGITSWSEQESQRDWKTASYDWAVFPPVPYSMDSPDRNLRGLQSKSPSTNHFLGTDEIGRDILAGIIHGSRYALSIGFLAMGIALTLGISIGAIAGYYGGWVDIVISRLIEIVISLPTFFLIITIVAMFQQGSLLLLMTVIGLTNWTNIARLVRGEVLRVRTMEYITAGVALGYSPMRIITRHVLPNALAPVLVSAAFGIASAILIESSLSFLGIGVPATVVTWGSMLSKAKENISMWWVGVFPGIMIFLVVSSYNLIGDALRDATDPRLRQ